MNHRSELARMRSAVMMSQREMAAQMAGARRTRGMHCSMFSEIESGMRVPTPAQVRRMALLLEEEPAAIIEAWRATAVARARYLARNLRRRFSTDSLADAIATNPGGEK